MGTTTSALVLCANNQKQEYNSKPNLNEKFKIRVSAEEMINQWEKQRIKYSLENDRYSKRVKM